MTKRKKARTTERLVEMPLHELRDAMQKTQTQLAAVLLVNQSTISKLERRTDMYVSTLRSYIEAMGGELEILAKFPSGNVRVSQFQDE